MDDSQFWSRLLKLIWVIIRDESSNRISDSQCGDLKTRSWKYTSMKPQSIQNWYAYSLIDVLNTKNKKHLQRLDMSEKTWILCQGDLWTERRTFSLLNVSFQDLGDSRKSLKWIVSFATGWNLGILNLTIANINHFCTQIHLFITRTMVFSPTKPKRMKIYLFLLSTEASSYAEISRNKRSFRKSGVFVG